jgi:hypothetical protein
MLFVFLEHVLGLCFYVGLIIFKNPLVEEGSIQIRIVLSFLQRSLNMLQIVFFVAGFAGGTGDQFSQRNIEVAGKR